MKTLFKVAKLDLDPYYFHKYVQHPETLMGIVIGSPHALTLPTKYREIIQQALIKKKISKTFTFVWTKLKNVRRYK